MHIIHRCICIICNTSWNIHIYYQTEPDTLKYDAPEVLFLRMIIFLYNNNSFSLWFSLVATRGGTRLKSAKYLMSAFPNASLISSGGPPLNFDGVKPNWILFWLKRNEKKTTEKKSRFLYSISCRHMSSESCKSKPNLDCNYPFTIDLAPIGIPIGAKSVGAG